MNRVAVICQLAFMGLVLLYACATPGPAPVKLACPAIKPFTPAQQLAIATEIDNLQSDDPLVPMAQDWVRMRDDARACQAAKP